MADQYGERVQAVVNYVRANPTRELSLAELADIAHFSPFHFHRIFSATTGETVGGFVRRARLERAIYLMKSSPSKSLASIAVASGFSSHSDFTRVFKAAYGIPPSSWDRVHRLADTEIEPPPAMHGPGRFGELDGTPELAIRNHHAARVAYKRVTDPWRGTSLADGYRALTSELSAVGFDWAGAELIGMSWDSYDATEMAEVTFDLGFVTPNELDSSSIDTVAMPPMRSVEVHSDGPMIQIAQTWDYLYLEWLPSSGYEPANLPALKRFRRRPDEIGWDRWDVDCCIPIVKLTP